MDSTLDRLAAGNYLLVSTYKKDGSLVATPVWAVRDGDALGIWTVTDSWKVKRIRNRADVLVGPCDMRGKPTGEQVPGTARILSAAETDHYRGLLRRKYGLLGLITVFVSRLRRGANGTIGIRIELS